MSSGRSPRRSAASPERQHHHHHHKHERSSTSPRGRTRSPRASSGAAAAPAASASGAKSPSPARGGTGGAASARSPRRAGVVFGASLASQPVSSTDGLPYVVSCCTKFLRANLESEGLFRVSGSRSRRHELITQLEAGKRIAIAEKEDAFAVADTLKQWLRDLPDCILLCKNYDDFIKIGESESKSKDPAAFKELVRKLPDINFKILKHLAAFFRDLERQKEKNKMGYEALGVVLGPNLLFDKDRDAEKFARHARIIARITENILRNATSIFKLTEEGTAPQPSSSSSAAAAAATAGATSSSAPKSSSAIAASSSSSSSAAAAAAAAENDANNNREASRSRRSSPSRPVAVRHSRWRNIPEKIIEAVETMPNTSERTRDKLLDLYLDGDKDAVFRELMRTQTSLDDVRREFTDNFKSGPTWERDGIPLHDRVGYAVQERVAEAMANHKAEQPEAEWREERRALRRRLDEAQQDAARERAEWLAEKEKLLSDWMQFIDSFSAGIRGTVPSK